MLSSESRGTLFPERKTVFLSSPKGLHMEIKLFDMPVWGLEDRLDMPTCLMKDALRFFF